MPRKKTLSRVRAYYRDPDISRRNGRLGGRPRKPTKCPRCKQEQPSARAARRHCR